MVKIENWTMSKLKILLIIPNENNGEIKHFSPYVSLGIPYVAAIIKQSGYHVEILNLNFFKQNEELHIARLMHKRHYDIVGVGGNIYNLQSIHKILNTVKANQNVIVTLVGGIVLLYETELVFNYLGADYGVIGDADITLPLLLKIIETKRLNELGNINNIIYRNNGQIVRTNYVANTLPIDTLPYPDFDLCNAKSLYYHDIMETNKNLLLPDMKIYHIVSGFNCVRKCTFCANQNRSYRGRSLESIVKEMEYAIENYRIFHFFFANDLFSISWEKTKAFCRAITDISAKYNTQLHFGICVIVKGFNENIAALLKQSGCNLLLFGFESYADNILKSMKKGITTAEISSAINICRKMDLTYRGIFIFGDVEETTQSIKQTLDYWKSVGRGFIALTPIVLLPGSELYDNAKKRKLLKNPLNYLLCLSAKTNRRVALNFSAHLTKFQYIIMLNRLSYYDVRYKLYAKITRKKKNTKKFCNIEFICENCNRHNHKTVSFPLHIDTICNHCGAINTIYSVPTLIMDIYIIVMSIFMLLFGWLYRYKIPSRVI
jgi:radical SAM superfamily enzyme YgiQ (UPF0313 family)